MTLIADTCLHYKSQRKETVNCRQNTTHLNHLGIHIRHVTGDIANGSLATFEKCQDICNGSKSLNDHVSRGQCKLVLTAI